MVKHYILINNAQDANCVPYKFVLLHLNVIIFSNKYADKKLLMEKKRSTHIKQLRIKSVLNYL